MNRIHISPVVGTMPVADIGPAYVEAVAQRMLSQGLSPKTVRNVLTYLRFLNVEELEVIRGIPDQVVVREPAPSRKGRSGRPRRRPTLLVRCCGCSSSQLP